MNFGEVFFQLSILRGAALSSLPTSTFHFSKKNKRLLVSEWDTLGGFVHGTSSLLKFLAAPFYCSRSKSQVSA